MRRCSALISDPGTSLMSQSDTAPPIKIRSSLSRKIRHGVLHKSQMPGGPAAKKSDKVFCGKDLVASRSREQKLRCIASFCRHHSQLDSEKAFFPFKYPWVVCMNGRFCASSKRPWSWKEDIRCQIILVSFPRNVFHACSFCVFYNPCLDLELFPQKIQRKMLT